jgi:hypothetical protein
VVRLKHLARSSPLVDESLRHLIVAETGVAQDGSHLGRHVDELAVVVFDELDAIEPALDLEGVAAAARAQIADRAGQAGAGLGAPGAEQRQGHDQEKKAAGQHQEKDLEAEQEAAGEDARQERRQERDSKKNGGGNEKRLARPDVPSAERAVRDVPEPAFGPREPVALRAADRDPRQGKAAATGAGPWKDELFARNADPHA